MTGMRGFTAVAGQRPLSMGTLLIAAGALALYQMTSLVLGPAGSRQLHLSLNLPAVEPDDRSQSWSAGPNLSLGTLAPLSPAVSTPARPIVTHRASVTQPAHRYGAPATPVAVAVAPQPPIAPPAVHPTPPVDSLPVSHGDGQHGHED